MQVFRTVGKPLQILIRVTLSNETPVRRYQAYENIALSGGEAGFVGIVGRNGSAQGVGRHLRHGQDRLCQFICSSNRRIRAGTI